MSDHTTSQDAESTPADTETLAVDEIDGRSAVPVCLRSRIVGEGSGRHQQTFLPAPDHRRTVATTRRFVRRQRGWFRRDPRIGWLTRDGTEKAQVMARMSPVRAIKD